MEWHVADYVNDFMRMHRSCIFAAILAATAGLALAAPSHAQIASYVDEHGKLIFVNGDSPKPHGGSTISSHRPSEGAVNVASPRFSAAQPAAPPPDRLDRIVREAAERHKLDPALVKAVIST